VASLLPGLFVSVEGHFEMADDAQAGLVAGLRRVLSWRAPPNWSATDWREELRALAIASSWQAGLDYEPSRGVPLAGFVSARVTAQALTRYRQEWRYALRVARAAAENTAGAGLGAHPARAAFYSVDGALRQLPEPGRWLLDQLFWHNRTETSIAAELHISQPAIHKRKRAAILHLRALLVKR
jgi:DNA-directed RNA polymerase specialized sigma24 family protein